MLSFPSVLLVLLMLLKLAFVVPMVTEQHGAEWGLVCLLICIVGYGSLIFLEETSVRRQS